MRLIVEQTLVLQPLTPRSFAALAGHYQAMFWYRVVDSGFRPAPVLRSNESHRTGRFLAGGDERRILPSRTR
jgi:hypothetical protein